MSTTTSNFGWTIPQSTDLVKDGATAIAALGNGVDTSMAELKGGTTGQILSKTSNTDMDFTWTTPNPGDITSVVAGAGLSGGGTSGDVTISTAGGVTGRNPILNSNMSIWQRGTSISVPANTSGANGRLADMWQTSTPVNCAATVSRQATSDTTNLPNIQYCMRFQRNSGQTGTGAVYLLNTFESINSIPFAGKVVTASFYARAGANYSQASNVLPFNLFTGTGTDQNPFAGFTGQTVQVGNATLTTTWQRFTFSFTVASNTTQIAVGFYYAGVGTAGTNDYFEVTGLQLEVGAAATAYQPNGNTYQAELAACQRYYWRVDDGVLNHPIATAFYYTSTSANANVQFPVTMRTAPSIVQTTGTSYFNFIRNGGNDDLNSFTADQISPNMAAFYNNTNASGTAGQAGFITLANTSGSFAFSAEL